MNELIQQSQTSMLIWESEESLQEIRKVFAPKLSELEWAFFVGMGKGLMLNPFLREIWAVKYDEKTAAQIFIGRDGYRVNAARHPEYEWHTVNAVYEKDLFKMKTTSLGVEIEHEHSPINPGKLVGAYCLLKKKSMEKTFAQFVPIEEYQTGKSLWKEAKDGGKPSTMIKKVAEAQTIRLAFPDKFNGTYSEYEEFDRNQPIVVNQAQATENKLNALLDKQRQQKQPIEGEAVKDSETGEVATPDQLKEIHALVAVKGFNNGRMAKAMEYYKIETLGQLTVSQANHFIGRLKKEEDK